MSPGISRTIEKTSTVTPKRTGIVRSRRLRTYFARGSYPTVTFFRPGRRPLNDWTYPLTRSLTASTNAPL
jgi:hypothetical protein